MDSTQPAMNSIVHSTGSPTAIATITLEKHYTVSELSKLWLFSENTIRRLFDKEPGVIKICRPQSKKKRSYTSLRIPERIAIRVYRRMQGMS